MDNQCFASTALVAWQLKCFCQTSENIQVFRGTERDSIAGLPDVSLGYILPFLFVALDPQSHEKSQSVLSELAEKLVFMTSM